MSKTNELSELSGSTGSSWLSDGVKEIERIVARSMIVEPKIFNLPLEKPGSYAIVVPGPAGKENTVEVKVAGPTWHEEELENPKQLAAFIASMDKRGVRPADGAVYVDSGSVTYVYSFEDRRHRATCPLITNKPWDWLATPQKPLSQRDTIRTLRILFDGCLSSGSNLIGLVRNIRFKQDSQGAADIQPGREALGRTILREVTGAADFPDEFTLSVNVFENVAQAVTVRVAMEILTDVEKFELIPFPNQIHNGQVETLEWIRSDLAQVGVPTFLGSVGV